MVPLKLYLKGFKGIKSGLGLDEIELDLTQYSKRVLIYGPNGSGKSTILGNLHPYILMPDRVKSYSQNGFSYYDECYLGDSKKILIWKYNETVYKTHIEIDAIKRKTKAYLYTIDGEVTVNGTETPVPGTEDGSVDTYISVIESLIGPPELFFTSVFRSQDAKRLSGYTRSEMESIFMELLNINQLELYIENAKNYQKELIAKSQSLQDQITELDKLLSEEKPLTDEIKATVEQKNATLKELNSLRDQIEVIEKDLENLRTRLSEFEGLKNKRNYLLEQAGRLNKEIADLNTTIVQKKSYYNQRYHSIQARIKETRSLIEQKETLLKQTLEFEQILKNKPLLETTLTQIDRELTELQNSRVTLSGLKEKALIYKKQAELLKQVPCKDTELPEKCPLLKDAIHARESVTQLEQKIQDLESIDKRIQELIKQKSTLQKELSELNKVYTDYTTIKEKLSRIDETTKTLELLNTELQTLLKEGKTVIKELETALEYKSRELATVNQEFSSIIIPEDISQAYEQKQKELKILQESVLNRERELSRLEHHLGRLEERLALITQSKEKKSSLALLLKQTEKDITEWNQVIKIFSELIPLEIEDAGPEISSIANELLKTTYGPDFSITIITKTSGKTGKEKSVFDILVYDARLPQGVKKPLYYLSGGERVWIEEAVTKAICLYNAFKSGYKYRALFTDERDGALDVLNRKKYFDMKEKVLELGNFEVEYIISHSPEAFDYADHVINLTALSGNNKHKGAHHE
jgi:exonuclease SbcC